MKAVSVFKDENGVTDPFLYFTINLTTSSEIHSHPLIFPDAIASL